MTKMLFLLMVFLTFANQGIEDTFYEALYKESLPQIDSALNELEKEKTSTTQQAYKGALLMKKSGFLKLVAEKVALFKEGHQLLEAAIKKYPQNAAYRFIRLTIQEHAPKILKYNKNIAEDKALIIDTYSNLSPKLKAYILDYAGQSKYLTKDILEH